VGDKPQEKKKLTSIYERQSREGFMGLENKGEPIWTTVNPRRGNTIESRETKLIQD